MNYKEVKIECIYIYKYKASVYIKEINIHHIQINKLIYKNKINK